jgi:protein-disulfide isomerase
MKIRETYGNRVRLVYRDLPLENHEHAFKAAEAALCAEDQGKFWPYHDLLFQNQGALQIDALKRYASSLGLDGARFATCLDSGAKAAAVKEDLADATEYGVSATPTFFVNGRTLSGAQPFEAFKAVIDEELARTTR